MSQRKQPETMCIEVSRYYDRLAWLQWRGAFQEANALREFAVWFDPPLRVDESRVERRVQKYIEDARRLDDPVNWT